MWYGDCESFVHIGQKHSFNFANETFSICSQLGQLLSVKIFHPARIEEVAQFSWIHTVYSVTGGSSVLVWVGQPPFPFPSSPSFQSKLWLRCRRIVVLDVPASHLHARGDWGFNPHWLMTTDDPPLVTAVWSWGKLGVGFDPSQKGQRSKFVAKSL